ncbi:RecQ family ATP-dependent DNA helicase [uncultured Amnibacterium sp.]|uniref:RecQ family ATP-dependent DNA helicase n=1 Tax=uncultured Amnibacterium sp. TaxID=1631851 RepID=UPI0035CA7B18
MFGWDPLRPGLARAVEAVLAGADVLGVMPTGYGKSAVYRIAGALLPGLTVIVSPLIALQADQLAALRRTSGTRPAAQVNSGQSAKQNDEAWTAVAEGRLGYLFLAPEQLANDDVVARLAAADVSLFAIDEAHCVSAWGHDFRPDYLGLGAAADAIGRPPVLALTATGSRPVREEILERLGMQDSVVLTHGFDRPNIHLRVVRHADDDAQREAVLDDVATLAKPGLLYVATRKATESYAQTLDERGVGAAPYHAGLGAKRRRQMHLAFHEGEHEVVVATSAFGMGVDKADIRFVVHAAVPESVDEYYQELGRAGRDGAPAAAVLHYRSEDLALRKFFDSGLPKRSTLLRCHTAIADGAGTPDEVAAALGISRRRVTGLLHLLQDADAVRELNGAWRTTEPDAEAGAAGALELAESRRRIDESRIAMMRSYAETQQCRRQFLLAYFGDEAAEPCGNCDTCESGSALEFAAERSARAADVPFPVDAAVDHAEWGPGTVMSVEDDRITVFFESQGYRVLALAAIREHGLLTRMDDDDEVDDAGGTQLGGHSVGIRNGGNTMSDPILSTTGNPGAGGDPEAVLDDDATVQDAETVQAESQQTVTNDAVAGETVLPGSGEGNDGPTGGAPGEGEPELPENELQGEDIDLDDDSRTL